MNMTKPPRQKGVKLTPHQVESIERIAEGRPGGGITFSQAIREAVDLWLGESPQALNEHEMYALRALRSLKKRNPALWASVLRTIHSAAESTGAGMSEQMYEDLGELTETHPPAPTKRRKSAG